MNISKILRFNVKSKRFFTTKPIDWCESYPTKKQETLEEEKHGSKYWSTQLRSGETYRTSLSEPQILFSNFSEKLSTKRDIEPVDLDPKEFKRKFVDVEDKLWCSDKNNGKKIYYPKYGNSFYEPQDYNKN